MKRVIIASLVLLAAGVAFFAQQQGYNDQEHEYFQAALWRLKQLDASFNEDLLRVRFSLLESYDEFQNELQEMNRLADRLRTTPVFVSAAGHDNIQRAVRDFTAQLQQRRQLFENFKSRNAVLANSRRYFPLAASDLDRRIGDAAADRELHHVLDDLISVLLTSIASAEELPPDSLTGPARLREWAARHPEHVEAGFVSTLAQHAQALLSGKSELDRLTRTLLVLPTDQGIERLSQLYEKELTSALRRSQNYRVLLYLLAALLTTVVAYALWALRDANRGLEARVTERTRQLQSEAEERKRADEARHLSEQFLQSLVENLPVHIFRTDREGRVTFANKLVCDWLGRPLEEIVGRTAPDLLPPDRAATQLASERHVLATGRVYEATEQQTGPDGLPTFIQIIKVPVFDAAGACLGVQSMFLDITARKRAEHRFIEASGLLDTLLENTPDHIYFKDLESRFVRFSNALLRRWHLADATQLHGKTDADFYSAEHAAPARADEVEIIRTGRPIVGKLEKETYHDGTVSWALTTKMPWHDGEGNIIGTFGISRDVTALKESEDRLAYERDQLRALLDASPDTIYFKDPQSRFVLASRSKIKRTIDRVPDLRARRAARGLPVDVPEAELLTGMTDFDTFATEDAQHAYEDEQRIVQTGEPVVGKLENQVYLDGTERWALSSKMPWRDREGKIIGTFGISKDITDLKLAEEKLEQMHRQLLDTSRQAGMAEVATGVLHNVGNVLNSVNVSATLVTDQIRHSKVTGVEKLSVLINQHKSDLAGFLTRDPRGQMIPAYLGTLAEMLAGEQKTVTAELEQLRKNIEHIKEIVAMQQSYARTSGVVETISVPDMVEDALRINSGSLARHDVHTTRDYQARPVVTTDKHKVMQILINLVRNAKYACDESGRTDKLIIVRTTADDRGVSIAIIDNGVGIPAENLTRVFAHGFTTRKHGHGFGLHSGALAAKELGGSLTAHSEGQGRGATFLLTLPFKPDTPGHDSHAS
jgi:PAS domain S-box-containing protein